MKKVIMIDPPAGWRYGFPKAMPAEDFGKVDLGDWLVANGLPSEDVEFALQHCRMWESTMIDNGGGVFVDPDLAVRYPDPGDVRRYGAVTDEDESDVVRSIN